MLLLCYFIIRVDTILVVGARHPVWKHTSLVLFFCLFSISRAGCSSVARKPLRSVRVNGVGSHEIGSGFNSRRRSHPRFNSLGIRSHPRFNSLGIRSHPRFNSLGIRSHPRFNSLGIRSHPRFNSLGIRSHDSVQGSIPGDGVIRGSIP